MAINSKPMYPRPPLAKLVGATQLRHAEASKRVWAYIRLHRLQDNHEWRNINVDETLSYLLHGKKVVSIFEVARCIAEHLQPLRQPPLDLHR